MTNEFIQQKLVEKFSQSVSEFEENFEILNFTTSAENNLKILQYLKDELDFQYLNDLTAVHFPDSKGKELMVVYLVQNIKLKKRVRLKVSVDIQKPDIFTATKIYSTADWLERECYDFFGVNFVGHPNLIRIMNVPEMNYFPLRKEYPLEDQTRIDKDDEMFGRTRETLN